MNEDKMVDILDYCKGHTHEMWAAYIVSIILDCDFRDSTYELQKFFQKVEGKIA